MAVDVNRFDVVVIGAGFAGLSAAARLASRGARPLVVEARSGRGGRATAFADRETGALADHAPHVLPRCSRATFAFLREAGAADNVRLERPPAPLDAMYAEPARAHMERRGGEVRAGAAATVVTDVDGGAVTVVRVGSDTIGTARVVSAVPWFAFGALFDREPPSLRATIDRTRRMAASPIVSVNLWFDRPIFDEPLIGLPGRAMQWAFNKSAEGGDAHGGHEAAAPGEAHVSLVSSGADAMLARTNEDLIRAAHDELLHALPASRAARLL